MPLKLLKTIGRRLFQNSTAEAPSPAADGKTSTPAAANSAKPTPGGSRKGAPNTRTPKGTPRSQTTKHGESWSPGAGSEISDPPKNDARPKDDARPRTSDRPRSSERPRTERRPRTSDRPEGRERPRRKEGDESGEGSEDNRPRRSRSGKPRSAGEKPAPAAEPVSDTPWSPDQFAVEPEEGKTRFHDLDLPDSLMHAIADLDFKYCTPIQAEALPKSLAGENVAGQAQTGTGKTAAFLVTILAHCLKHPQKGERKTATPRALILGPTRELVIQIASDAQGLSRHSGCRCVAVYGGMDYAKQQDQLAQGGAVDIVAATPGRLIDFQRQGVIDLSKVEFLVIDEADRMLDMGFIPDVRRIVSYMPRKDQRKTMLFSATLTDDVMRLASQWMPEPTIVKVDSGQMSIDTISQLVYAIPSKSKFDLLYNLIRSQPDQRMLVFCNRRVGAQRVADELYRRETKCELLSGAVTQKKRLRILEEFRSGEVRVVIATDVAGRGLHVEDIALVVNFDFPYEPEDYIHRIGRTGRAGKSGIAVSFACEHESFIIPEIEKLLGEDLKCVQPEPELLKQAPRPTRRPPTRSLEDQGGGRGGGGRSSGGGRPGGRGGRSGGGSRPGGPRRSSGPRRDGGAPKRSAS